ncbi:hypothetical protein [Crateriforma spongiae]|uniref:hypothetical protein n=1 Tax=Crateriforma spongiae TaxID=2724528 RepID=UPI001444CDDB|nr:hypothetical protein [Crateriforma spongiae]
MDAQPTPTFSALIRIGQIITFALIQGLILIAAVMTYMTLSSADQREAVAQEMAAEEREPAGAGDLVLPGIATAFTAISLAAAFFLPPTIRKAAVQRFRAEQSGGFTVPDGDDPIEGPMRYLSGGDQAARIVTSAIFEGVGVMGSILMMIQGDLLFLIFPAIGIAGIASQFPTLTKVQDWMRQIASQPASLSS